MLGMVLRMNAVFFTVVTILWALLKNWQQPVPLAFFGLL